jgi:putative tryptophan/tyrosine transport system substrate-binding protein
MAPSGDPVRAGFVTSLARPGGNITGVSWLTPDRSAKLLEVLKDAVPKMSHVAVLWNSANPLKVLDFGETQRAAQALRLTVSSIEVKAPRFGDRIHGDRARARPDALLILVDEVLSHETRPRIA